jgi:dienelactone hydrolase
MGPLLFAAALLARGQLVENVACASDASQTYTLYLPSAYTAERRWPLLVVMDPRGRGTKAAEIFRPAAEANGWILISSNGTRSDTNGLENDHAVNAMIGELSRYAIDEEHIYAAGFSGTATIAWIFAQRQHLAGVIASCPPWLDELDAAHAPFAYFVATGTTDFNNLDAHRIDREMTRSGKPHHLEVFDGTHQWMPQAVATRAVEWMQHPSSDVTKRSREELAAERYEQRTVDRIIAALRRILASNERQTIAQMERELDLPAIRKTAEKNDAQGLAARRVLQRLFIETSFYLPEKFRSKGDAARAAIVLEIAAAIKPDR